VVPLIDTDSYGSTPHAELACTVCHDGADSFPHNDQKMSECAPCHRPHDEKKTHAAHPGVSCQSCHLQGVVPVKNTQPHGIAWKSSRNLEKPSPLHHMALSDDKEACRRCHFEENEIGAAAMVLPAKSILCMPCHAATFSVGDATTIISLFVFLLGIISMFSYFLTGSISEFSHADWIQKLSWLIRSGFKSFFLTRFKPIAVSLFFDVLLQRRLYRQSPQRWAIHGLIYFPFLFRFLWGIIALCGSLFAPSWSPVWDMLNKNHPATALLFDLTGFMIVTGLILAVVRARLNQPERPRGLPQQDLIALGLIAGIVVVGFVLEGMRIAMTGRPPGSAFAFIGFVISQLFSAGPDLNKIFGYVWYLHAILTGAFVAYIPFSRLSHIILAPISLSIRASTEHDHV
jgi:nitrate reductase gamma subunit